MEFIDKITKLFLDVYFSQLKKMPQRDDVFCYFNHKVKHTFAVANTILDIMFFEKSIDANFKFKFKHIVESAGVLHDIARFLQFDEKGNFIPNHIFKHGLKSVEIVKKSSLINDDLLFFAIASHDLMQIDYNSPFFVSLNEENKKNADIIAKLLRDADKFENMQNFVMHGYPIFSKNVDIAPLSQEVKNIVLQKSIVDRRYIKTGADMIADVIFWINDIYFDYTKSKIKSIGYFDFMLDQFVKFGASNDDVNLVKNMVSL